MASLYLFFVFMSISISQISMSLTQTTDFPPSILLPVTKDDPTNQYLTRIYQGNLLVPTRLVLDLNGPVLWLSCPPSRPSPVHCRSIQCFSTKSHPCGPTNSTSAPTCTLRLENAITGAVSTGELVEDEVAVQISDTPSPSQITAVDQFLFPCGPSVLLKGLASGTHGVLGLGRTRLGAPSQISHSFGYAQKFSLCLSSSNGMILSGHEPKLGEISKSLIYTPLIQYGQFGEYYVNLKSVQIQNHKLSLGEISFLVKISSIIPYTTLESKIYQVFIRAFSMAAEALKMRRVSSVGPFGACYEVGSAVPVIDLVLQSEMVKWRIHGHNSMVKVGENVMCMGFIDGGVDLGGASIVLGGHQLEDNLLEFDFGSSMLGFSSSLIMRQTSCSQLSLLALHKNHQPI